MRAKLSSVLAVAVLATLSGCGTGPVVPGELGRLTMVLPFPAQQARGFAACVFKPWDQAHWDSNHTCADNASLSAAVLPAGTACVDNRTPFAEASPPVSPDRPLKDAEAQFAKLLQHPVLTSLACSYSRLGHPSGSPAVDLTMSAREIHEFVGLVRSLTMSGGWTIARTSAATASDAKARQRARYAAYVEAYLDAYFRNTEFAQVNFSLADLYTRYPALKPYKTDLDKLLQPVEKDTIGKVGESQFTDRTGRQLQFPAVTVTVDPTVRSVIALSKIDYGEVGADLVRVVIEALFDAADPLPAVAGATALTSTKLSPDQRLPLLKTDGMPPIKADELAESNTWANALDGAAASGTGQLVRGGGLIALNNEYVAKAVETIVGEVVRKWTEKVAFCYFACKVPAAGGAESGGIFGQSAANSAAATVNVIVTP